MAVMIFKNPINVICKNVERNILLKRKDMINGLLEEDIICVMGVVVKEH